MGPATWVAAVLLLGSALAGAALAVEGDIVFKRQDGTEGGTPPAVFPHWIHRIRYKCYACHPSPYEMRAGANPVSMEEMMAGKSCGACHNGQIAWAVTFETCDRCHAAR